MDYLDFTVRIRPAGRGFEALVIESPAGEGARCSLELPFSPEELVRVAQELGRAVRDSGAARHVRPLGAGAAGMASELDELGRKLADALFRGAVRDRFLQSHAEATARAARGLRVKLRLDLSEPGAATAHRVPWELLVSPETGHPLALSRRTPLVRYLEVPGRHQPPPPPASLEVRLVAARPAGAPPLALDAETAALRSAVGASAAVTLSEVPRPTLSGVVECLRGESVHVLHVMAHGESDPATGEGSLALEDADGELDRVSGLRLVEQAGDFLPALRLVFLNACRTAEAIEAAPFAGVATALLAAGVPAVVAMRYPVTDGAAALFASTVYRRLAAGDPIDEAVTEGRLALRNAMGRTLPDLPEWATPALFLRLDDGRLFLPPTRRPAAAAGAMRRWRAAVAVSAAALLATFLAWRGLAPAPSPSEERSAPTEPAPIEPARASALHGFRPGREPEAGAPEPAARPSALHRVSDGESVHLADLRARVTVDFLGLDGEAFVRITAALDERPLQHDTVVGPETLRFRWGSDELTVAVHQVDWSGRIVRLAVSR